MTESQNLIFSLLEYHLRNNYSFEQSLPNMETLSQSIQTRIWFLMERHM